MKKAVAKSAKKSITPKTQAIAPSPVSLGIKRNCNKCSTKFYDFNKAEINCPKCGKKIDPNETEKSVPRAPAEAKKARPEKSVVPVITDGEEEAVSSRDDFEDISEIDDEDEGVDIDVENESEDDY